MHVKIRCYATLNGFEPENRDHFAIEEGETAGSLLAKLQIPPEEVRILFVNSKHSQPETELHDGDKVGFFPAVGGG